MDEFKQGECRWCSDAGEVYADNDLCEDCDSNVIRCSVCDEDYHVDSPCRHVFKDRTLEWCGSGAWANDHVRESFFFLLDLMPRGFADDLRSAIAARHFHTFFVAPIIGSGITFTLHGTGKHMWEYGKALAHLAEDDEGAEDAQDGYRWMASLFDADTKWANDTTISWIDDWKMRSDHMRWADDGGAVVANQ